MTSRWRALACQYERGGTHDPGSGLFPSHAKPSDREGECTLRQVLGYIATGNTITLAPAFDDRFCRAAEGIGLQGEGVAEQGRCQALVQQDLGQQRQRFGRRRLTDRGRRRHCLGKHHPVLPVRPVVQHPIEELPLQVAVVSLVAADDYSYRMPLAATTESRAPGSGTRMRRSS